MKEKLINDIKEISDSIESIQQKIKTQKLPLLEHVDRINANSTDKIWTQQNFFEHIIFMYNQRIDFIQTQKDSLIKQLEELEELEEIKKEKEREREKNIALLKQKLKENPKLLWTKRDFDREKGIDVDSINYGDNFRKMINSSLEEDRIARRNWYEDGGGNDEWSSEP